MLQPPVPPRATVVAVAVTLAVQTLTSMAMIAPSVLAPVAAPDLGLAPQAVGLFVSISYLAAMASSLTTGRLTARFGPFAVCQAALVLAGAGLLLGKLAAVAALPLAALAIGFGYGLVTPVSSHLLARRTPPAIMALVFSIKQTGVPIGGAIAGAAVPLLVLALGWTDALPVLAAVCIAAAFALLPARATLAEPPAVGARGLRGVFAGLGRPIQLVLADRALRELAFASLGYAMVQLVFITYFVSYLNLHLGYSLVTAGLVYALAHGSGIVGRIAWGAVADRWVPPRAMLAALGAVSAACGLLTAAFSSAWPLALVVAVGMLYAASAVGWNGVYLAEVARCAPPGQVGTVTGGTQFFTFGGAVAGPPLFAGAVSATGSYAWAFALFAIPPLLVAARLAGRAPRARV
ncbi:MAG: MFS transporter [Burkholderiales bacterium]